VRCGGAFVVVGRRTIYGRRSALTSLADRGERTSKRSPRSSGTPDRIRRWSGCRAVAPPER
jgi:hypothetical protein